VNHIIKFVNSSQ